MSLSKHEKNFVWSLVAIVCSVQVCLSTALAQPAKQGAKPVPSTKLERAFALIADGHVLEGRRMLIPFCHRPDTTALMYCYLALSYIDDPEMDSKMNNEIVNDLNMAIKMDPDTGEYYRYMAKYHNIQGQWDEALKYEDKALKAKKPDRAALKERSGTYASLGRYKEALTDLDAYLAKEVSTQNTYFIKATLLQELKRYDEAAKFYRLSIGLRNQDRTIIQLARCLDLAGKYQEAISELNKVIKTTPLDDESLVMRGRLHRKNKNLQLAVNDFSKALEIEPRAKIYTERASLYRQLGQKAAEVKDLAKAKELTSEPF